MKTKIAILFAFVVSVGTLSAQPLRLTFDASVANATEEGAQIPQIPTQFEFQRKDGTTTFNDLKKLYTAFKRTHGPYFLPPTKFGPQENPDLTNPSIKEYTINIADLKLSSSSIGEMFLRSTGFLTFSNYSLIQNALLIPALCKSDKEKNEATCNIKFPSVQIYGPTLENISYIRVRVFRKGEVSASEIQALPADVLAKLNAHLEENSRLVTEDKETGRRDGYFLYSNYHFEATLKECNEGMLNEAVFEWRYALSQAYGRLALLAGEYWIEREVAYSDGKKEIAVVMVKLDWGTYKGKADLDWTKVDNPREYRP